MDTRCAKVVTDLNNRDHILIEGRLISLYGPTDEVNFVVDKIVRDLRRSGNEPLTGVAYADRQADPEKLEA